MAALNGYDHVALFTSFIYCRLGFLSTQGYWGPGTLFVAHASYADLISFRSKRCIKDSNNALHTSDPSYDR
jgi:hypothetical protein